MIITTTNETATFNNTISINTNTMATPSTTATNYYLSIYLILKLQQQQRMTRME